MTVAPEDTKIEIDFVAGRYALPRRITGRHTSASNMSAGPSSEVGDTDDDGAGTGDKLGSAWSGAEDGGNDGTTELVGSVGVVIAGMASDIPILAASRGEVGIVGGTIVVRGVNRAEERKGLEKVLKAIVSTDMLKVAC
jgi:1-phosphatidylinositol-3-phosphate 5-kinase